jgi:glycine/D-amino acid oxidase-like deaminating enzyme
MQTMYDFIPVGCGGIGSAAAYWLSKVAGADVLAIERFHAQGAAHAFKFAGLIDRSMRHLAVEGHTNYPILASESFQRQYRGVEA